MNRYKFFAILWTLFTIGLSSIPSKSIPKTFLNEILGIDKVAHIIFYLVMCMIWALTNREIFTRHKAMKLSLLLSVSIGLMMEIYQKTYFIDRSFDWYDSVANVIGALIGAYLFLKYEKVFPIFAKPTRENT